MARDEAETLWDAIICGAGLAGLTLALQLRRELPSLRIAVVERTRRPLPPACHKVGESNAELGSLYLERLGLREYLRREHIVKLGLRFFPGGGTLPLESRTEIGPSQEPVVKGYQIDRGLFEQDVRGMIERDGVALWEGATVRGVKIGQPHELTIERDGERMIARAKWVVDATGRSALLRRRFGGKQPTAHVGNAGWFRIDERLHLHELAATPSGPWHDEALASERWRSTNHLMGPGYWVWIIALPGERTSIGVVTFDAVHGFDRVRTLDRTLAFLREHEPALAERVAGAPMLDFRCIKAYSHGIERSWSADRWAIVGDAGAFVDPLYSPGTDFIAFGNSFTTELLRADTAGEDLAAAVEALDREYAALIEGSLGVYRKAAPMLAHARAWATKIYWDNFAYWAYTCQYFLQGLFRIRELDAELSALRRRFVQLSGYVQSLLHAWTTAHPEAPRGGFFRLPAFPSFAVDAHLDLQNEMTPQQTLESMRMRVEMGEQMVAELVVRALLEHGPDAGRQLLDAAGVRDWDVPFDPNRADVEPTVGLARRRATSRVVRDVERVLGRVERHPQWTEAVKLLHPQA
jgi:flavin-dependent dehydrogenase